MDVAFMAGLGGVAAILQVAGYLVYLRYFVKHTIRPNAASWLMFAYGTALLAFFEYEHGASMALLLLPGACAAMSIIVALMCLRKGATERTDRFEATIFSIDLWLTVMYVGLTLGIGKGALPPLVVDGFLIAVNLTAVTCFIPLVRSTWREPDRELPAPWLVWTAAYSCLAVATWQADGGAHPTLLLYPVLNAFLHGLVGLFALRSGSSDRTYLDADGKLYISGSEIHGRGVYAGIGFSAGDVICRMSGKPVFHSNAHGEPNYVGISPNVWIDPDPPIDTVNHSCDPNAAFGRNFELIALRIIHAHDEITFDYSTTEADPNWSMDCACGTENCRGQLHAIQISFADQPFPPPASPVMQQVWRTQRHAAGQRPAFPQLGRTAAGGDALDLDVARRERAATPEAEEG
jgi:hypothetical protein